MIDDGSPGPEVGEFLWDLAKSPKWDYCIRDRRVGRDYGGFYNNMRLGLEKALAEGYDYCFFFEDDEQFLWRKDDYPEYIDQVFSTCPDAVQLQPLFFRRVHCYDRSCEFVAPANAYRTNRGFTTTGIWNLAVLRDHPDYRFICAHGDDLPANSAYWMERGYRLYFQFDPTVGVLPWIATKSSADELSVGREVDRPSSGTGKGRGDELILAPLSGDDVRVLREREACIAPYQEYFDTSRHVRRGPIWHREGHMMERYEELCHEALQREDAAGESPLRIPVLDEWRVSQVPPASSHMGWDPWSLENSPQARFRKHVKRCLPNWLVKAIRKARAPRSTVDPTHAGSSRKLAERLSRERDAICRDGGITVKIVQDLLVR